MLRPVAVSSNWQPSLPGPKPFQGAHHVIKLLNAGNCFRDGHTGTIVRSAGWRIDLQPSSPTEANLQIQKDGVHRGPSSIACVLVPMAFRMQLLATGVGPVHERPRFRELTNALDAALNLSISSRKIRPDGEWEHNVFRIEGAFSS